MKIVFQDFIATYGTCQRNKGYIVMMEREFQPLSIPTHIWIGIFLDLIVGIPIEGNKSMIIMVVRNISKYSHLCSLSHPFTPFVVSKSFMDHIFKLCGMPTSIVLDWDPTFYNEVSLICLKFNVPS
jgi:hypothetical protein